MSQSFDELMPIEGDADDEPVEAVVYELRPGYTELFNRVMAHLAWIEEVEGPRKQGPDFIRAMYDLDLSPAERAIFLEDRRRIRDNETPL